MQAELLVGTAVVVSCMVGVELTVAVMANPNVDRLPAAWWREKKQPVCLAG